MLNSPCNPTGTVYTRAELEALVDVGARRATPAILSDEIYEQLTFGDAKPTCIATLRPGFGPDDHDQRGEQELRHDRLADGLDGRPAPVVKAMDAIQSQETSCPSSVSQAR